MVCADKFLLLVVVFILLKTMEVYSYSLALTFFHFLYNFQKNCHCFPLFAVGKLLQVPIYVILPHSTWHM